MNKFLLALTILSAGAGASHVTRQSTIRLQHEAKAARETWLVQTQLVAAAQSEQAGLTERIRELKQTLAQSPALAESALWSALQTNRTDRLPPELRERLLEELGFNWQSSADFIVVSKETVRAIGMQAILRGKLTDMAATVLALTPEERGQIEAAVQRVQTVFKDWVLAHYTLPGDPAMSQSLSNNFATALSDALGKERTELFLPSASKWMVREIGLVEQAVKLIIKRDLAGNETRLKAEVEYQSGRPISGYFPQQRNIFPRAFRPVFPNGWADVAKREGFELPEEPPKK